MDSEVVECGLAVGKDCEDGYTDGYSDGYSDESLVATLPTSGTQKSQLVQLRERARAAMKPSNYDKMASAVPAGCASATQPAENKIVASWDFTLGSITLPIAPVLSATITFYAAIGLKVGFNFAPCGGVFDLAMYATAAATPFGVAKASGSIELDLKLLKLGVEIILPIINVDVVATATVGAKLQDLGSVTGDVTVRLVLHPWVFKINLFMTVIGSDLVVLVYATKGNVMADYYGRLPYRHSLSHRSVGVLHSA